MLQSVFLLLVVHPLQGTGFVLKVLQMLSGHVLLHAEGRFEGAHGSDQRFHVVVDALMQFVSGGAFGELRYDGPKLVRIRLWTNKRENSRETKVKKNG